MSYQLSTFSMYEDQSYYWFAELLSNGFYKVDKKTLVPELLFHFPNDSLDDYFLYPHLHKVGDWFVFSPWRGKDIVVYHEKKKELKVLPLKQGSDNLTLKYAPMAKFSFLTSFENDVFFFPLTYPAIVKLNLSTMTLTYLETAVQEINAMIPEKRNELLVTYCHSGEVKGRKVYFPLSCSPYLGIYDMKTDQLELHEMPGNSLGFHDLCLHGDVCYLTPELGSDVVCFHQVTKESRVIPALATEEICMFAAVVHSPFAYKNKLYLCPFRGKKMYCIDLETDQVEEVSWFHDLLPRRYEFPNSAWSECLCVQVEGGTISFISGKTNQWFEVDLETKDCTVKTVEVLEDEANKIPRANRYIAEKYTADLSDFCAFLSSMEEETTQTIETERIGQRIFNATT